jgi:hypothetical protein
MLGWKSDGSARRLPRHPQPSSHSSKGPQSQAIPVTGPQPPTRPPTSHAGDHRFESGWAHDRLHLTALGRHLRPRLRLESVSVEARWKRLCRQPPPRGELGGALGVRYRCCSADRMMEPKALPARRPGPVPATARPGVSEACGPSSNKTGREAREAGLGSAHPATNGKPLELIDGGNPLYLLQNRAGMEAKIIVPEDWVEPEPDA